jgi:5-methyltetrahydropteroyltriglutamate--homocysteine methyltransferase
MTNTNTAIHTTFPAFRASARARTEICAGAPLARRTDEAHWKPSAAAARPPLGLQRDAGLDFVTVGDFAFYDQVANHIQLLGCEPARYGFSAGQSPLSRYFTMARGRTGGAAQRRRLQLRHAQAPPRWK